VRLAEVGYTRKAAISAREQTTSSAL
jgi:hypothetical protein